MNGQKLESQIIQNYCQSSKILSYWNTNISGLIFPSVFWTYPFDHNIYRMWNTFKTKILILTFKHAPFSKKNFFKLRNNYHGCLKLGTSEISWIFPFLYYQHLDQPSNIVSSFSEITFKVISLLNCHHISSDLYCLLFGEFQILTGLSGIRFSHSIPS